MAVNEPTSATPTPRSVPALLLFAGLALVCLAACWLGIVAGRPFVLASRMRQENAKVESRLLDMRMETQSLRKEVAALSSDVGMEREARRRGYVREGEQRLMILSPAK
jgi:hypothetical protein